MGEDKTGAKISLYTVCFKVLILNILFFCREARRKIRRYVCLFLNVTVTAVDFMSPVLSRATYRDHSVCPHVCLVVTLLNY